MIEFIKNLFRQQYLNIYITDDFFQIVRVKKEKGVLIVEEAIQKSIPAGVIKNGEIIKEKELSELISSSLTTKIKKCNITISDGQAYEYIFYLPKNIDGDTFTSALEKLVEETIPLDLFEIKYDYKVSLHGNVKVVFVTAIKKEVLAQYYEVLSHFTKLSPVALEPSSLSLLRNIPHDFNKDQGSIIIDIDGNNIKILTLWSHDIFDSQQLLLDESLKSSELLIKNIKDSAEALSKITQRKVTKIIVSGDNAAQLKITDILNKGLKTEALEGTVEAITKYKLKIDTGNGNDERFRIVSGLALRDFSNRASSINLLYKKK